MSQVATKPTIDPIAVLQMMADGLTYRDVAGDLGYATSSVRNRMQRYFNDTGADNMVHAVAQAFRAGILK